MVSTQSKQPVHISNQRWSTLTLECWNCMQSRHMVEQSSDAIWPIFSEIWDGIVGADEQRWCSIFGIAEIKPVDDHNIAQTLYEIVDYHHHCSDFRLLRLHAQWAPPAPSCTTLHNHLATLWALRVVLDGWIVSQLLLACDDEDFDLTASPYKISHTLSTERFLSWN